MPPEGQVRGAPAEGQVLQASGVEDPTLMVESRLVVFLEPQCGQAGLEAEELETSLSKSLPQSLQMYS